MRLRYTEAALADLEAILAYIDAHSPQSALRVQTRLQTLIDLLEVHPAIGVRTSDPTIRRMTTSPYPYLVFYEATEPEVIIHAIRHGARQGWPEEA